MEQDHANSLPGSHPGAPGGSTAEPGRDLLGPGTMVVDGRYRLASIVARNGNDTVYSALDERARSRVRLRITAHAPDPELLRLLHPSIPAALDSGRVGRWHYVVLEWFDGQPVELPAVSNTADLPRLRLWATAAMDLLDALEHAHSTTGRAHGDIGLHGLWKGTDGHLRILDFSGPGPGPGPEGALTADAVPYASPERLRGLPRDPRSDLYAIGSVLFALAYGSPPFGTDPIDARAGHLLRQLQPPPPAGSGPAFLPSAFLDILRTALEKQPQHRYASAARMRAAFQQALHGLPTVPDLAPRTPLRSTAVADPASLDTVVPTDDGPDLETEIADGTMDVPPDRRFVPGVAFEDEITRRVPRRLLSRGVRSDEAGDRSGALAMGAGAVLIGILVSGAAWVSGLAVLALIASRPVLAPPASDTLPPLSAADLEEPPEPPAAIGVPSPEEAPEASVEAPPASVAAEAPTLPGPQQVPVGFPADGWKPEALAPFPAFVELVRGHRGVVRLTGHTDSRGPADVNYRMGLGRAWAVQKLLALAGIEVVKVPIASKGETEPIGDNATPTGRAANRRVTAEFFAPGEVVPEP